jgi:hypothetical protein
LYVLG